MILKDLNVPHHGINYLVRQGVLIQFIKILVDLLGENH